MSTLSRICQLCSQEVDYDETRDDICIDCLHIGFRLVTYFASEENKNTHQVEVHKEPEGLGPPEDCIICHTPTQYWTKDKHTPLCQICSLKISKAKAARPKPKK